MDMRRIAGIWFGGALVLAPAFVSAECPEEPYYRPIRPEDAQSREPDAYGVIGGRSDHASAFIATRRDVFTWESGAPVLEPLGISVAREERATDLAWLHPVAMESGSAPQERPDVVRVFDAPAGEGRPIVALFCCGARDRVACRCHYLHHETFCADRLLPRFLDAFRFVEVDVDDLANADLLRRFGVDAAQVPALLVVHPKGMVLDRMDRGDFERFKKPEAFAVVLDRALQGLARSDRVVERRQRDLEKGVEALLAALGKKDVDMARHAASQMEETAAEAGFTSWMEEARRWLANLESPQN